VGNNRIFYSCLGVALAAPNALLPRIQSADISASQSIEYSLGPEGIVGFYANSPDISCSYTQIIHSFDDFNEDPNQFVDLYMLVGPDNVDSLTNPTKYILCRYLLLESIEYNLSVQGFFNMTKTFKGFSRYVCDYNGGSSLSSNDVFTPSKQNFNLNLSSLPDTLSTNPIQNITIKKSFNRKPILESGTKTPYAFVSTVPTETTISVEMISQNLDHNDDGYDQTFSTVSCSGPTATSSSIDISICSFINEIETNSSLSFSGYLSSINYSGGDSTGSNQTINIEYTSYDSSTNFIEFPDVPTTGCF